MKSFVKIMLSLFVITAVCAVALGAVNYVTAGPIAEQAAAAAREARQSAYPEAVDFKVLYDTAVLPEVTLASLIGETETPKEYGIIRSVYAVLDADGSEIGIVANVVTKGFSSGLHMTVGVAADGTVRGVVVGDNAETAGLGAKASEDEFEARYAGLRAPITAVKAGPGENEVEAISGATITSRGVTNAVNTVAALAADMTGGAQ